MKLFQFLARNHAFERILKKPRPAGTFFSLYKNRGTRPRVFVNLLRKFYLMRAAARRMRRKNAFPQTAGLVLLVLRYTLGVQIAADRVLRNDSREILDRQALDRLTAELIIRDDLDLLIEAAFAAPAPPIATM